MTRRRAVFGAGERREKVRRWSWATKVLLTGSLAIGGGAVAAMIVPATAGASVVAPAQMAGSPAGPSPFGACYPGLGCTVYCPILGGYVLPGSCAETRPTPPSTCPPGEEWEMVPFFFTEVPACAPPWDNAEGYPDAEY